LSYLKKREKILSDKYTVLVQMIKTVLIVRLWKQYVCLDIVFQFQRPYLTFPVLERLLFERSIHCKKGFNGFPSPSQDIISKLSLAGNNLPGPSPRKVWSKKIQESRTFFYSVSSLSSSHTPPPSLVQIAPAGEQIYDLFTFLFGERFENTFARYLKIQIPPGLYKR